MRVALTFDFELPGRVHAEPDAAWVIRDALRNAGVRSTWFMQGRACRLDPRTADLIASDGHLIGSHSYFHADMPMFHEPGLDRDVSLAQDAIIAATGVDPVPWFRCPNLASNANVEQWLADRGYWQPVGADVIPADWEPSVSAAEVRRRVVEGVRSGAGPIVLLHTWPRTTAEALPGILADLSDCEFVRIDEL